MSSSKMGQLISTRLSGLLCRVNGLMRVNHSGQCLEEVQQLAAIKLFVFLNQQRVSGVQLRHFLKLQDRSVFKILETLFTRKGKASSISLSCRNKAGR